ncbi:uncharacterized protein F4822DRAFT_273660 [Hypoxylon trugodes]|uniref:uncharacterized protein n=1 Tax=Hypoxylon trugodes TaxID=326681 RepID=UPI00219E4D31|nr:uncharacterized protein F4822DRAFT_273660 [Hypoxylon trugodes]KAI1382503.1 hypothetical protein F4822DRAFT_273660 [Hypoxylon trugodes]
MGGANLRREEYRDHKIAPVTVVSASGIHVRIVQGYVDGDKECVFVRKSRIINIDGNEQENLEELVNIACWLLGSPCRKTEILS